MTLSIIIVNFNTREILKKCLASLSPGTTGLKGNWEVIVVDNGSVDGSVEWLRSWVSGSKRRQLILNRKNLGFAGGVNRGIKKARGNYILLLNSDIICQKKAISRLVVFASEKNLLGLVGGRLLEPSRKPQASVFHLPTAWRALKEFWLGEKGAYLKYLPQGKDPVMVESVVGAVMLIPRTTIRKTGLLSEDYFMYFEDLDYCRRLKKEGLPVYYLPAAKFIHFHGSSGKKNPGRISQYLVNSSRIYFGRGGHFLINLIIRSSYLWRKIAKKN
ncbi:MAG: glycosyltransferase family 2 protein [Candidatus Pacebacteria bacterium]|nr:glycosyltransferase family 2 protein [Candidatus Paceibacterota bacterium]